MTGSISSGTWSRTSSRNQECCVRLTQDTSDEAGDVRKLERRGHSTCRGEWDCDEAWLMAAGQTSAAMAAHRCLDTGSLGARVSWSSLRSSFRKRSAVMKEEEEEPGVRLTGWITAASDSRDQLVVHCEPDKFSNLFYFFSSSIFRYFQTRTRTPAFFILITAPAFSFTHLALPSIQQQLLLAPSPNS